MVDVLSARFRDIYAKWETRIDTVRNLEPNAPRFSLDGLRRAGKQIQERRVWSKEQARKVRENSLYRIKDGEPFALQVSATSSVLHVCCSFCTPASRNTLVDTASKQSKMGGTNVLAVNPGIGFLSKVFRQISHVCSSKKYDYPNVAEAVMNDERLTEAIEVIARQIISSEGGSESRAVARVKTRARTILSQMQSNVSNTLLGIVAWILYKLLPRFIKSVVVQVNQIEMLRKASDFGLPLILLPTHRSYMDHVIIYLVLLSNDIESPLIVIKDKPKISFFRRLLSGLGAFFIKSRIDPILDDNDVLYRAVLRAYLTESLGAGQNVEFFVESDRSRSGKPSCTPDGATLSVIVDAYADGTIEDALLVPIAVNYERLVDGNFAREQLGQPEGTKTFGSTWSTLMGNYGIVKVDICQPFSLREMLESFRSRQDKSAAKKTLELEWPSVDSIARHIVYDCWRATPIMSTNVVAFLLLNKFRDGCTFDELIRAFNSIRQELEWADKNVAFCGENVDIINHALDILGPGLVERQVISDGVRGRDVGSKIVVSIRPVSILPNVIELSYYGNTMILHYVMDSVVASALYAVLKSEIHDPRKIAENDTTVFQDDLVEKALRVCDILKYEFVFCKPCQDLEHTVVETIRNVMLTGIISLKEEVYLEEEMWSRRYAQNFDDSSDEEYALENLTKRIRYKLNSEPEYSKHMEFLHTPLRPLIDAYASSAFALRQLVGRSVSEEDLLGKVSGEMRANLDRGTVSYGESLCLDSIRNSLKLFEDWNVLECHSLEKVETFRLAEEYNEDAAVNSIYEDIATFRWIRNVDRVIGEQLC